MRLKMRAMQRHNLFWVGTKQRNRQNGAARFSIDVVVLRNYPHCIFERVLSVMGLLFKKIKTLMEKCAQQNGGFSSVL